MRARPSKDHPLHCLDEIEEEYSIACSDCTGEGNVHSQADLVSRNQVKAGSENPEAYELAKQNYHRYLVDFLLWFVFHRRNIARVEEEAIEVAFDQDPPPNDITPTYRAVMAEMAPTRWKGNYREEQILQNLMEKTAVAELKCRHTRSHPPRDRYGIWEKNETHLAEHRPYLNNISTALRRGISEETLLDFTGDLQLMMHPVEADDYDGANSETYNNQVFINEVNLYWALMKKLGLEGPPPRGPTKPGPGGLSIPYDILEFVPQYGLVDFNNRFEQIREGFRDEVARCETITPRGHQILLGGRDLRKYTNNEHFVDRTLALIFEFLALDSGLTTARAAEIGQLFYSVLTEPWYLKYGNGKDRQPGEGGEGHEEHNAWLRDAIIELDNALSALPDYETQGFIDNYWDKICYEQVVTAQPSQSIISVYSSTLSRWRRFYSNWLQILANVELSHTKLTQEQLDAQGRTSCILCGDDYDVNSPYDCAVDIGCENHHIMCKKCYTQLSLTPTKPYTDLEGERHCPECRSVLRYERAIRNVTEGLDMAPSFQTDLGYVPPAAAENPQVEGEGSEAGGTSDVEMEG